jgi:hypothetical protein
MVNAEQLVHLREELVSLGQLDLQAPLDPRE